MMLRHALNSVGKREPALRDRIEHAERVSSTPEERRTGLGASEPLRMS